jgi:hypothetical protein
VRDDELRRAEGELPVRVAVEVDEVRLLARFEVEQPLARIADVVPRLVLPLELPAAGGERRVRRELRALRVGRCLAHRRQHERDVGQAAHQFERVRPDAADGVGRHQHLHRAAS